MSYGTTIPKLPSHQEGMGPKHHHPCSHEASRRWQLLRLDKLRYCKGGFVFVKDEEQLVTNWHMKGIYNNSEMFQDEKTLNRSPTSVIQESGLRSLQPSAEMLEENLPFFTNACSIDVEKFFPNASNFSQQRQSMQKYAT